MQITTVVLVMDGQPIRVNQVLASGWLGGWIVKDVEAIRDRLRAASLAELTDYSVSDADFQEAIDAWRVDRNLLAGDELEAWLANSGISLKSLTELVRIDFIFRQLSDRLEDAPTETVSINELISEHLLQHLLFDDRIEGILSIFIRRAAIEPTPVDEEFRKVRAELLSRANLDMKGSFQSTMAALELSVEGGGDMLDLEVSYEIFRRRRLSIERLQQELKKRRNDLTSYVAEIACFDDLDAAKEVLCFVRHHSESLTDAAARAGVEAQTEHWYFNDLHQLPFGARLVSACEGEVIGPFPVDTTNQHTVVRLLQCNEPSLDDTNIRNQLEWILSGEAVRDQVHKRIRNATEFDHQTVKSALRELIHT